MPLLKFAIQLYNRLNVWARDELSYHLTGHLEWQCRLMQTSANGHLSSHEQLQEFCLLKGRFAWAMFPSLQGMLMLLQLKWDDCGCSYKPGDSSGGFLAWMNGAVLLSIYWYTLWHPLPSQCNNSTTYKIHSSAWVPAIVFKISFCSLVVCMIVLNAQ